MPASALSLSLFLAGVFLVDFAPLAVYRYLLVGDVLLVAAFVLHARRHGLRVRVSPEITVVYGAYLLSGLASLTWSQNPAAGLFTWLHIAFLVTVFVPSVHSYLSECPTARRLVVPALVATGALQGLYLAVDVAQGLDWRGPRIPGVMGSAALYFFGPATIGAVMLLGDRRWPVRCGGGLALLPILFAVAVLRSRSLWVGTLVGLSVLAFLRARHLWTAAVSVAALCGGVVLAYIQGWLPSAIAERITASLSPNESIDLVYRQEVVAVLWRAFVDSPLVGFGIGQSAHNLPAYLVAAKVDAVHNIVIHAMFEGGLVAGVALAALPVAVWRLWRRARFCSDEPSQRLADWALASFAVFYTAGQFTPALYDHASFLVLAVAAAAAEVRRPPNGTS